MTEKERMIALLNYCFDNNIELWNNQDNIKTVESFIISIGGLASNTEIIGNVSDSVCPECNGTKKVYSYDDGEDRDCLRCYFD